MADDDSVDEAAALGDALAGVEGYPAEDGAGGDAEAEEPPPAPTEEELAAELAAAAAEAELDGMGGALSDLDEALKGVVVLETPLVSHDAMVTALRAHNAVMASVKSDITATNASIASLGKRAGVTERSLGKTTARVSAAEKEMGALAARVEAVEVRAVCTP
jgi:hypothetical protein